MPSEGSDQVADSVATDFPTVRTEVEGEAEGVEENLPPTAEPGTGVSSSWADLSEVQNSAELQGFLNLQLLVDLLLHGSKR